MANRTNLQHLLGLAIGQDAGRYLLGLVSIHPAVATEASHRCSRAVLAQALNLALLHDLLARVPTGQSYADALTAAGRPLVFDHGALRTVDSPNTGALPQGEEAIARILRPLGYRVAETYPLDRLGMTGRAYRHADYPHDIPQFFVSELHVSRFSAAFQAAADRVTRSSTDVVLPALARCFGRQHHVPALTDYEVLLAESAEMAWLATEGNAFNHATDRVHDIATLVQQETQLGRRLKATVEVSSSGRIQQTAYFADPITRSFVVPSGAKVDREVPGSFFEFIQRGVDPATGMLDLGFDTGNAQGIFKMTDARTAPPGDRRPNRFPASARPL